MSDLQSKTDEELNVMLAELMGWTFIEKLAFTGIPKGSRGNADARVIPRYCSSLDEVAKVEAGLLPNQWSDYTMSLRRVIQHDCNTLEHYVPGCDRAQVIADFWFYCANPRQRTIALIQTLQKP